MIEKLTEEQEKLIDVVIKEYFDNVFGGNDEFDKDLIERMFKLLYSFVSMEKPKIVYCDDPFSMAKDACLKKNETIDAFGCGYDSGWTAFYDYFNRIGVQYDKSTNFDLWRDFILKSGVFSTIFREKAAFVCRRPIIIYKNQAGVLHCENGKAIKWRNGEGEYFLNGVLVNETIVLTPSEKLDVSLVLNEKNIDVRREILRKIGIERFIYKTGSEEIDKFGDYALLEISLPGIRKARYLKMKNPSIGIWHIEGVSRDCKTVMDALHERKPEQLKKLPIDDVDGDFWYQQGDVCVWPKNAKAVKRYPKVLT